MGYKYMKCDLCGKDKNCQTWEYVIKGSGTGRVRQYSPGRDVVYKVGGREVGRESNTTYSTGKVSRVVERGTATICIKCRILWSIVAIIVFSILLSLIATLLYINMTTMNQPFIGYWSEIALYIVPVIVISAFTPFMKHFILSVKIAFKKKVLPWKVMSKFWE